MTAADATRLAGEAYSTRLAHSEAATPDDKTRVAQEGYQSRIARSAASVQPDVSEFYKVGEKIGDRYEVSAIHHGELGVVYGCFDHRTKLPRALKTVRARHASDKQVLSLFESEATVWISLEKHPYIVRAYLVERFKNLPYVITEYIRGPEGMEGDLRGWLGHPRLTLPVAVAMALQIAQGMQHAVRKVPNLVHRDLKPANILVNGDGKAMVTDFGLVHAAQSGAGTPAYMSPEQWRAEALDARSDIYAYGGILFEMFTAHRLFPALTERDWERAHLESSPAALTSIVPELPGEINQFVRRCLEKSPAARPQNWDEIVAFFAEWYHRLTGKAVVLDFSSLALDAGEWIAASYSLRILGRYEEALRACDRALAIDQNYAHAWYCKGINLEDRKRYSEALEAYDRVLVIDENHEGAWRNKGRTLYSLKRYEEAAGAYDRALTLDPNNSTEREYRKALKLATVVSWSKRGNALLRLERYEEALQAYDRALAIDQYYVEAWNNKGVTLGNLKRYEEAIQAYDRALPIAINQDLIVAWNNKGNALSDLKRYEEAIQAYDQALAIDQNYAEAWNSKGNALNNLKRYEDAIQAYDRALATDQNDGIARSNKGIAPEVLAVGDEVTAKVLKIDTEKNRVSLGLKQLDEGPWVGISRRYPQGTRLIGEVTNITDYGPFVEVEAGIEGLVHVSEMDWINKNVHPSKVVQVGDVVEVMILEIDEDRRRISLGMKQCMPNPWEEFGVKSKKGDKVRGQIKSITDFGIIIGLAGGVDGMVHLSDLSWSQSGSEAVRQFKQGDEVEAMVLSIDVERERVSLGIKQCMSNPVDDFERELKEGDVLAEGKRYEEAVAAYDKALALNPGDANAWLKKGHALLRIERYEEALSAYDHASSLDANGGVSFIKGFTLLKLKRYEESISACDRAIAINPSFTNAQNTKSLALQELKHREAALSMQRPQSFWARLWDK